MKFKIGDRVRALCGVEAHGRVKCGDTGTVCNIHDFDVGVDWDRDIGGHNCRGTARQNHGWNVLEKYLELENSKSEDDKATFEVGDIVKITNPQSSIIPKNAIGIVRVGGKDGEDIGVEILSHNITGHSLSDAPNLRLKKQGWWVGKFDGLEKVKCNSKIQRFKIGDRVECSSKGIGTIVNISLRSIAVYFDLEGAFSGHDCGFDNNSKCGWWVTESDLKKIDESPKKKTERDIPAHAPDPLKDKKNYHSDIDIAEVPEVYIFVARDRDGKLFAYMDEPKIDVGGSQYYAERYKKIKNDLFAELKFDDGVLRIRGEKSDE